MVQQTFLSEPIPQTTVQRPIKNTAVSDVITGLTPVIVEGAKIFQTSQLNEEITVAKSQQVAGMVALEDLNSQRNLSIAEGINAGLSQEEVVDSPEVQVFNREIDRLRAGKVSGKLTTAGFDARVNDLVKQASVRAPAFSADFRQIGGTTKGGAGSSSGFFGTFEQSEKEALEARERESIAVQKFKGGQAIYTTDPLLKRMALREISDQESYEKRSHIDAEIYVDNGYGKTTGKINNLIHSFTNEAGAIDNTGLAKFTIGNMIDQEIARVESGDVGGENVTTNLRPGDISTIVAQLTALKSRTFETIDTGDFAKITEATKTIVKNSMFLTEAQIHPEVVKAQVVYGQTPKATVEMASIINSVPETLRPAFDELLGGEINFYTKLVKNVVGGDVDTGFGTVIRNMQTGSTPTGDKVGKYVSQGLTDRLSTKDPNDKNTVDKAAQVQVQQYTGEVEDISFYRASPKSWNHFTDQPGAIQKWNDITPDIAKAPFMTMPEGFSVVSDLKSETVAILDSEGKLVNSVGPRVGFSFSGNNRALRQSSLDFLRQFELSKATSKTFELDPIHTLQTPSPVPTDKLVVLRDTMLLQEQSRLKTPNSITESGLFGTDLINTINNRFGTLDTKFDTDIVNEDINPVALPEFTPEEVLVEQAKSLKASFPDATLDELVDFITKQAE